MLIKMGTKRPGLVVTVAPGRGGRTVGLRLPGGENLIDPGTTNWAAEGRGEDRPEAEWRQDFGQVVWLGPQARFWSDQTVIPGRPADAAGWPPDPVCVHGVYAVVESTPERLCMRGPESPVWQVELTKTWEAFPDGSVRFMAEAKNVSGSPIRKGLWFNFRAQPATRVEVPVAGEGAVRVAGGADLGLRYARGWVEVNAPRLADGQGSVDAKVFLRPLRGMIRIRGAGGYLELSFKPTESEEVAEGHTPVEIYRKTVRDGWSILEVEQHGPCVTLGPGEMMRHEEVWRWVGSAT